MGLSAVRSIINPIRFLGAKQREQTLSASSEGQGQFKIVKQNSIWGLTVGMLTFDSVSGSHDCAKVPVRKQEKVYLLGSFNAFNVV
jgi:hypothetical protein